MDIGSAFTFAFDDQDWVKKIAIGGAITLAALILLPVLVGLALFLPLNGYMLATLKNVRDGQATPLPEWRNFGALFSQGLMVLVIGLVYNLPVILVICPVIGIAAAIPSLDPDLANNLAFVYTICLSCGLPLALLIGVVLFPAALIHYVQHESLGAAFRFREIFSFISQNLGDYVIVILLGFAAQFIASLGMMLCGVGLLFTGFWSILVTAHLYGQLARRIPRTLQPVTA